MGMRFGGVLLGNGSKPGDVLRDTEALARAKTFFALSGAVRPLPVRGGGRRRYAVMSFVVNRAQAAEPKTAAYRAWRPRFFTRSSQ
ncbi:hypothetical protein STENM327S_08338 [Streptomyces tendae]